MGSERSRRAGLSGAMRDGRQSFGFVAGNFWAACRTDQDAGALLIEQNDEWLISRCYLTIESMAIFDAAAAVMVHYQLMASSALREVLEED